MWAGSDYVPFINIRVIALNFVVSAAPPVTIVTSGDINDFIQDTSCGISNPYLAILIV